MQFLLVVQSAGKAIAKSASKKAAENDCDDGVGLRTAAFRLIKPLGAVVDAVASHERTRKRAHVQQYDVSGMPLSRDWIVNPCPPARSGKSAEGFARCVIPELHPA